MMFGNDVLFYVVMLVVATAAVKVPVTPYASTGLDAVIHYLKEYTFQPPRDYVFSYPPIPATIDRVENDKNLFGTEHTYSVKMETNLRLKYGINEPQNEIPTYYFVLLQENPSSTNSVKAITNHGWIEDEKRLLQNGFMVLYISPYEYPRLQLRETLKGMLETQKQVDRSAISVNVTCDDFSTTVVTNRFMYLVIESNAFKSICNHTFKIPNSEGFSYIYSHSGEQLPLLEAGTLLLNIESESTKGYYGFIMKTRHYNNLQKFDPACTVQSTSTEHKTTTIELVEFQSKIIPEFALMRLPQWRIPEFAIIENETQDYIKQDVTGKYQTKGASQLSISMKLLRVADIEIIEGCIPSSDVSLIEILFLELILGTDKNFAFVTRYKYDDKYHHMNFDHCPAYEDTVQKMYAVASTFVVHKN